MIELHSKLPKVGTTIFTVMSALAKEHNAINLSQGFPDFDCDEHLKNLVTECMRQGYNQYPPMRGVDPLLHAIGDKVQNLYDLQVDPLAEITVTSGAAEGLFSAITALVHPGDEVILLDPAYDLYKPAIEVNGGIPVVHRLMGPDFAIDWAAVRSLITDKTRAIMINSPHNPIGRIMSREDMLSLEQIVLDTGIFVISDEVYEHLVFDGEAHESVLKYPAIFARSFVVFSFGKTFHTTGWRVGYTIAPKRLTEEFRKVHQFNVFTVVAPIQYAFAEYLREPNHYLNLPNFFQAKRDLLCKSLAERTAFKPLNSHGSYFQLYDYSALSDAVDTEFAKELTIKHGVAVIPISVFYSDPDPNSRIVRFCFGKKDETLERAVERLLAI